MMSSEDIYIFAIIVAVGHYFFSMQRMTYLMAREFRIPQSHLDPLLPSWFLFGQISIALIKFGFLLYIAFSEYNFWIAIGLFAISALVHVFFPLFPSHMFFNIFYEKAKLIKDIDFQAGVHYEHMLKTSRVFR